MINTDDDLSLTDNNNDLRMYRLVKESGMELGVLITKKFNQVEFRSEKQIISKKLSNKNVSSCPWIQVDVIKSNLSKKLKEEQNSVQEIFQINQKQ